MVIKLIVNQTYCQLNHFAQYHPPPFKAESVEEAFQDARYEMEDCEVDIAKVVALVGNSRAGAGGGGSSALRSEIGAFVDILNDKATNFQFGRRSRSRTYVRGFQMEKVPDDVLTTKAHLVKLHARLMTAQLRARASERRWNVLLSECQRQQVSKCQHFVLCAALPLVKGNRIVMKCWSLLHFQALSAGNNTNGAILESTPGSSSSSSTTASGASSSLLYSLCNPWTWQWPRACQPYCADLYSFFARRVYVHSCRAAAVVCGALSCLVLWSEMLMSSNVHSPIGVMMTAYASSSSSGSGGGSNGGTEGPSSVMVQAVSFVALMYMSMCTYWPLFRINIGWTYKLQGPQQSSPFSLIFNAEYLSRLQFAIGYNFLMYLNVPK